MVHYFGTGAFIAESRARLRPGSWPLESDVRFDLPVTVQANRCVFVFSVCVHWVSMCMDVVCSLQHHSSTHYFHSLWRETTDQYIWLDSTYTTYTYFTRNHEGSPYTEIICEMNRWIPIHCAAFLPSIFLLFTFIFSKWLKSECQFYQRRFYEGQPIRRVCWQQSHWLTLVDGQCWAQEVPHKVDQPLKPLLAGALQQLEGWGTQEHTSTFIHI